MKVIIIGGVAGGASAAARLRRLDESAEIIMFERGKYISFANCGLPYHIGGFIPNETDLNIQTPQKFRNRLNVDVREQQLVKEIHREEKEVVVEKLETGEVYTESYDKLLIATGAYPFVPRIPGVDLPNVFTLRTIPDTIRIRKTVAESKPESCAVIGGGFVGLEMVENLSHAGLKVHLVDMANHVMPAMDYDMAVRVNKHLEEKGVDLHLGNGLAGIEQAGDKLVVKMQNGELTVDLVVLAIGVRPETELSAACGLELSPKKTVVVDEHMRTSDPDIYAVGDIVQTTNLVTGKPGHTPLAGPANRQGRIAADNICGIPSTYKGSLGTAISKAFDVSLGMTGLSEAAAKAAGFDYGKVYLWQKDHAAFYPNAHYFSTKVVYDKTNGRILGAQFVGYENIDKHTDVFSMAIRAGMTAKDLIDAELSYGPPYNTAKDVANMAGFLIENVMEGRLKQIEVTDFEKYVEENDPQIIDVRPVELFMMGYIPDSTSMQLAQLRAKMNKLDKSRPIVLVCEMGLNGYNAYRALVQNGFNCVNLSGGFNLYEALGYPVED